MFQYSITLILTASGPNEPIYFEKLKQNIFYKSKMPRMKNILTNLFVSGVFVKIPFQCAFCANENATFIKQIFRAAKKAPPSLLPPR
jgi:hypothetical protein